MGFQKGQESKEKGRRAQPFLLFFSSVPHHSPIHPSGASSSRGYTFYISLPISRTSELTFLLVSATSQLPFPPRLLNLLDLLPSFVLSFNKSRQLSSQLTSSSNQHLSSSTSTVRIPLLGSSSSSSNSTRVHPRPQSRGSRRRWTTHARRSLRQGIHLSTSITTAW